MAKRAITALPGAVLALAVSVLVSCQSAPADRIAASGTEEDFLKLDATELQLLDLRLTPDMGRLVSVRADLERAAQRAGATRLYQARVAGLQGQAALLAGDLPAARGYADAAARFSDAEEGAWLVRAALEPDASKRLAIIDTGLRRADRKSRLLCERGEALLKLTRYAEAAQDLDEGLRGLDDRYRALYGADRDKALSLAQALRNSGTAAPALSAEALEGPLTLRDMVERAFTSTRLLSAFSSQQSPSYDSARQSLQAAGLLLRPDARPETPCTRKDVAFFLWGIVLHAERNQNLAGSYRQKYPTSPVADVPADAPWYEAVLGVVEREIMDLPDGTHFQPDGPVTGIEYVRMLARVQKLYP